MLSTMSTPNRNLTLTLTLGLHKTAIWLVALVIRPDTPFGRISAVRCAATTTLCGIRQIRAAAADHPNFTDTARILATPAGHRNHVLQQMARTVRGYSSQQVRTKQLSDARHPDDITAALQWAQGPAVILMKSIGSDDKIHYPWATRSTNGSTEYYRCCRKSKSLILRDAILVYSR